MMRVTLCNSETVLHMEIKRAIQTRRTQISRNCQVLWKTEDNSALLLQLNLTGPWGDDGEVVVQRM